MLLLHSRRCRLLVYPTHWSIVTTLSARLSTGNDSVPKIIINDTINSFLTAISIFAISNRNSFRVLFDKNRFRIFYLENYVYILALEMASPGNRHCANRIGTLSLPIGTYSLLHSRRRRCKHL